VATIEFLGGFMGPAVTVEGDGPLVDICDDARAPVAFACRAASCGTCRVEVSAGAELLEPSEEDEDVVLDELDAPIEHRLACQAVVRPGPGLLRLRWVEDG
jgi:ferredoxin